FPGQHHQTKGEQESRWDGECHDQGRPEVTQKNIQNHEDQYDAGQHNVEDSFDRRVNEDAPIVKGLDLHTSREFPSIELFHPLLHVLKHRRGLGSPVEQHHTLDNVIPVIDPDLPQTNAIPDVHICKILHKHRDSVLFADDSVLNIL